MTRLESFAAILRHTQVKPVSCTLQSLTRRRHFGNYATAGQDDI